MRTDIVNRNNTITDLIFHIGHIGISLCVIMLKTICKEITSWSRIDLISVLINIKKNNRSNFTDFSSVLRMRPTT